MTDLKQLKKASTEKGENAYKTSEMKQWIQMLFDIMHIVIHWYAFYIRMKHKNKLKLCINTLFKTPETKWGMEMFFKTFATNKFKETQYEGPK